MTLEIYYNTELGAVIDRNKDTRCIAICIAIRIFHIAIYRNTLFGVSLHPYAAVVIGIKALSLIYHMTSRHVVYRFSNVML